MDAATTLFSYNEHQPPLNNDPSQHPPTNPPPITLCIEPTPTATLPHATQMNTPNLPSVTQTNTPNPSSKTLTHNPNLYTHRPTPNKHMIQQNHPLLIRLHKAIQACFLDSLTAYINQYSHNAISMNLKCVIMKQ